MQAENKKLAEQLAQSEQKLQDAQSAAEAAKEEYKLTTEQTIREKTAELTARLEQLNAELEERDRALEAREALLGEAGVREKAAGIERKNYEALLAAKDARIQVVEKQKLALAAQAEQQEALIKSFSALERPAYVLLGIFARRPPTDRLDSQTFKVLRAVRALVSGLGERELSPAEMRAALAVCGLVANDFERATGMGEAEVAELVRRYGAAQK